MTTRQRDDIMSFSPKSSTPHPEAFSSPHCPSISAGNLFDSGCSHPFELELDPIAGKLRELNKLQELSGTSILLQDADYL